MTTRALVLARGLGRRMQQPDEAAQLTDEQRRAADAGLKAMMPVAGRPLLDFGLSALADAGITNVGLIVAPDHEVIERYYTATSPPVRLYLDFLVQRDPLGTANALLAAESWAGDAPFLALNADNLYPAGILRRLAALDEPGLPVFTREQLVRSSNIPHERVQTFALLDVNAAGYLTGIIEKPPADVMDAEGANALVSMNCWRLDRRIFGACRDVPRSPRGEFELPNAVGLAISRGVRFRAVPARGPVLDLSRRSDALEVARRLSGVVPRP
ncbi:MAG: nucleotidyltransferase family protein [Acidobacteria bacterium]|nr:nucleotidyltransferase family protein [Acidobacteriota bacterium]